MNNVSYQKFREEVGRALAKVCLDNLSFSSEMKITALVGISLDGRDSYIIDYTKRFAPAGMPMLQLTPVNPDLHRYPPTGNGMRGGLQQGKTGLMLEMGRPVKLGRGAGSASGLKMGYKSTRGRGKPSGGRGKPVCATMPKPPAEPSYNGKLSAGDGQAVGWNPASGDCMKAEVRALGDMVATGDIFDVDAEMSGEEEVKVKSEQAKSGAGEEEQGATEDEQDESTEIDEPVEDEPPSLPKKPKVMPGGGKRAPKSSSNEPNSPKSRKQPGMKKVKAEPGAKTSPVAAVAGSEKTLSKVLHGCAVPDCNKVFNIKSSLRRHLKNVHGIDPAHPKDEEADNVLLGEDAE